MWIDEDYPAEIIDPDCEGLVYLEDDQASNMGSYRCPCCGRIIEYPAIHKELFQTSVVHRDETGIVAHIVALLHSLPQVNTVIQVVELTGYMIFLKYGTLIICSIIM